MKTTARALSMLALASLAPAAHAATITLEGITTPVAHNAKITQAPKEIASGVGLSVATGLKFSGGADLGGGIADAFLAWCFDLIHPISLGGTYSYKLVSEPFSGSYLLSGATDRVTKLFNAAYDGLDTDSAISTAAFQLAVWEVSNDDDFDLTGGAFRGVGAGSNAKRITARAQDYLRAGAAFTGAGNWEARLLETQEASATQNLVTATRRAAAGTAPVSAVPLPAAGLFTIGGLLGLGLLRRHRAATA